MDRELENYSKIDPIITKIIILILKRRASFTLIED